MNAESRQPVFSGNISVTENILDITQININSTRFVISQFSISSDISETKLRQYCKLREQTIPGSISIGWLVKYPIATSQLSRTVSQRAEKQGAQIFFFEKLTYKHFHIISLNFQ